MERRALLVIDSDDSTARLLAELLRSQRIDLITAKSGREALALLDNHPHIRFVLSDISLPDADGLALLEQIKNRDPSRHVVLMTAASNPLRAAQALRRGADDVLEKPLHPATVMDVLLRRFDGRHLASLQQRWRAVLDNLPCGLLWCSGTGTLQGMTGTAESLLDCAAAETIGQFLWQLPGLENARTFFETRAAQVPASVELHVHGRTLRLQAVETGAGLDPASRVFLLTDVSEIVALQRELDALSKDLDERAAVRARCLADELEFSQSLLDAADVFIAVLDPEGRLIRLNKFACRLLRCGAAEAERRFAEFANLPDSPLARIFNPKAADSISGYVAELPVPDGTRILAWSTRPLAAAGTVGARLIIGIDITELKQLENNLKRYTARLESVAKSRAEELRQKEAQLVHTARLAALGEIAAGIAHEMKQPLNVISIATDLIRLLLRNRTLTDESLLANLDKIRATVDRMTSTINCLRGFAHLGASDFVPVPLKDIVNGALTIVGDQIKLDDIDLCVSVPDDLPCVSGELHQFEQVLLNLLQNARHAIEDKREALKLNGKLPDTPDRITIEAGMRPESSAVFLQVSDTGVGLTDDVRKRIFEPFFTTKSAERGTGLGLPISASIVESHGGSIEVESTPGQGSTFRIVLPARIESSPAENGVRDEHLSSHR